jgi:hypothetical protein
MRCPQFGGKPRHRSSNGNAPVAASNGKPLTLDVKHPNLGRTAPPRDKPLSRNDTNRYYIAAKTPAAAWPFAAQQRFNLRKAR